MSEVACDSAVSLFCSVSVSLATTMKSHSEGDHRIRKTHTQNAEIRLEQGFMLLVFEGNLEKTVEKEAVDTFSKLLLFVSLLWVSAIFIKL